MKKTTIILFLMTLLYNATSFGQTVTIDGGLIVNNNSISSGATINLGTYSISNVNLAAKVVIPKAQNDTYPGTIFIYYQKNANSPAIIANGGNGGNLLFSGGLATTKNFNITLDATQFDLTGGSLYTEYKSYSGVKYKSGNVPIIKSSGGGSYVDVTNVSNTLCCDQIIRYGDKPNTITGNVTPNNVMVSWTINGTSTPNTEIPNTINFDYLFNTISTYRTFQSGNYSKKSNTITTTVVPSPILSNSISTNTPLNADSYAEFSNLTGIDLNTTANNVNLNILQDPFHINTRGDNYDTIDGFQWEYTIIDKKNPIYGTKNWIKFSNNITSILQNFNPPSSSSADDSYFLVRGIASYKGIKRVSNELKIMTRTLRYNNTICCDQSLKITSLTTIENPSTITGSTPVYSNPNLDPNNSYYSISYQWQSQKISRSTETWIDIAGATSKDYLPQPLKTIANTSGGRGSSEINVEATYNYRRIAKITYTGFINGVWSTASELCYSNQVNLSAYYLTTPYIKIYPNPTSSLLNIEGTINLTNSTINVINSMGTTVNSNNYTLINPNLISIDVSNLFTGTYFIQIITQRGVSQLTFIKN
ncbi:T9SS type A sorting domain-containing protein [Flavobacterium restrictum]|uniref:T9SS type A sorting domain-containing protein n=1 Tax=Flavobacterium restrictum TaxID=2594428 RepID=A0A553EAM6_9FLAO|nr:T9SS type A sorting domain-containing protein [Flavobacterium restrictum]TRX42109.1 T9SS type A sorting domain-containing protein [Flavobacterium restrictum]